MGLTIIPNYHKKNAEIENRLLMAKLLQKNAEESAPNPNQMVSGRVVPISPFATVLNGLTKSFANYQANQATTEQGQLEDEKRNYLVQALSGGNQITPEIIANAGGDYGDLLKMALASREGSPTVGQWYIPPGSEPFTDEKTGFKGYKTKEGGLISSRGGMTDYQEAVTTPEKVFSVSQARNATHPQKMTDEQGREIITTPSQANPQAYGPFAQPRQQPAQQETSTPDQELIMKAADIAFGPGSGKKMMYGGQMALTPEQDALFQKVLTQVTSAKPTQSGQQQGIFGMSQAEKDAAKTQQEVTKESLLNPVKKDFEGFKTNENIRQKEAEIEAQKLSPLPQAILKERTDLLDDISTNSSIIADLGTIKKQVDSGNLNLGFFKNLALKGKAYAGSNDPEVLNYNTYVTSLEKLRNDSLRLNKGIQTDSDARRAWDEIMGNPYNSGIVSKRLEEIQNINSRAMDIKKNLVNAIHDNYGKPKYDFSAFENQKPAINTSQDPELDAILKQYGNK